MRRTRLGDAMGLPRCSLGLVIAVALALPGATARATVPDRVAQDDATIVCRWHDPHRALEQMRAGGFSHVRINVVHAPGPDGAGLVACALPATLEDYDRAIAEVRAAGLVPQLTLVWSHEADPAAIADWMGQMAAHFAPDVQRFSVLNEPDLTLPAASACDSQTVQRMVSAGTLKVSAGSQLVKRYLARLVRVRRGGRTTTVWRNLYRYVSARVRSGNGHRYVVVRTRAFRWVKRPITVLDDDSDSSQQAVTTVNQGCLRVLRGRMYHQIFTVAEPAIRAAAPGAQVLAGETSPLAGVDLFIGQALPLNADGWAHHCYQWNLTPATPNGGFGVGDTQRVQALVGMPLFYTECGYPNPDSRWNQTRWDGFFTHDNVSGAYTAMWQYAKDQGVREMSQFEWCQNPLGRWDTSLMTQDDCAQSPEYLALQSLLDSWT
jgi:hypothetical protein